MAASASMQSLGWYLDHIKSTPLLSALQEKQLARRVREHSDPVAREMMIQANLLLVVKIAREYARTSTMLTDLVAEGNLGLVRAVEEFDPDAGVRFSTYAAWWIKQSIKKALINNNQPVHIPAYLAKLISRWRRTGRELEAHLGRAPTAEEIARKMKIGRKKADIIRQGLTAVNAPTQIGTEDTQAVSEMLPDNAGSPDRRLLDDSVGPIVQAVLTKLDERSRQILILRFHMDGYQGPPRTYKDIGAIIGLTRERVRQLEKEALAQLHGVIDRYY